MLILKQEEKKGVKIRLQSTKYFWLVKSRKVCN